MLSTLCKKNLCAHMNIDDIFILSGILTYFTHESKFFSIFKYINKYLENIKVIPIDPIQAPLQKGIFRILQYSEYFNRIRDACPESCGKHLIESAAYAVGVNLFEIDYILSAVPDRIRALEFSSSSYKEKEYQPRMCQKMFFKRSKVIRRYEGKN